MDSRTIPAELALHPHGKSREVGNGSEADRMMQGLMRKTGWGDTEIFTLGIQGLYLQLAM